MLKAVGVLFIVTGACGFAIYFSSYLKTHLAQLIEWREIFTQLDNEREYLRLPYAQLLRKTARGKAELFSAILLEVADSMEKRTQTDVSVFWEQAFERRSAQILLKEDEDRDRRGGLVVCIGKEPAVRGRPFTGGKIIFYAVGG